MAKVLNNGLHWTGGTQRPLILLLNLLAQSYGAIAKAYNVPPANEPGRYVFIYLQRIPG